MPAPEDLFGLWETKLREGKYLLLNPLLSLQLSSQAYFLPEENERLTSIDFTYHYEDADFLLQVVQEDSIYRGTLTNRDNGRRRICHLKPFIKMSQLHPCPFCIGPLHNTRKRRRSAAHSRSQSHICHVVTWIARTSSGFDIIEDPDIENAFRQYWCCTRGVTKARVEDPGGELSLLLDALSDDELVFQTEDVRWYTSNFGQVDFEDFSLASSDVRATGTDVVYRISFSIHDDFQSQMDTQPSPNTPSNVPSSRILPLNWSRGGSGSKLAISLVHHNPRSALPSFMVVACRGRVASSTRQSDQPCCESCIDMCCKLPGSVCGSLAYVRTKKDPEESITLMRSLYRYSKARRCSNGTRRKNSLTEISQDQASADEDVCVICLESLAKSTMVGLPNCRHSFHMECIEEYVRRSAAKIIDSIRCPVCHVMQTRVYGNSPKAFMYWYGDPQKGLRVGFSVLPGIQKIHLHPRPGEKYKAWLAEILLPPGDMFAFATIKKAFYLGQLLVVKDTSGSAVGYNYGLRFATRMTDDVTEMTASSTKRLASVGIALTNDEIVQIKNFPDPVNASALNEIVARHAGTSLFNMADDDEDEDGEFNEEEDDDDDEESALEYSDDDDESPLDYDVDDLNSEDEEPEYSSDDS